MLAVKANSTRSDRPSALGQPFLVHTIHMFSPGIAGAARSLHTTVVLPRHIQGADCHAPSLPLTGRLPSAPRKRNSRQTSKPNLADLDGVSGNTANRFFSRAISSRAISLNHSWHHFSYYIQFMQIEPSESLISRYMVRARVSQQELAWLAGVSQATVSRALRTSKTYRGRSQKKLVDFIQNQPEPVDAPGTYWIGAGHIVGAFANVWDGTEEHAIALARIIRACKDLRPQQPAVAPAAGK